MSRSKKGASEDAYYFDDPEIVSPSKFGKANKFLALVAILGVSALFLNTTLAANISLNSGAPIEFGQGFTQTVACSGATTLTVTPAASFTNSSGGGAFYLSSVTVSNIPTSCYGKDFTINVYGDSNNSPLAIFNTTSTNAVIYNNAGTFQTGIGGAGMSVTSGSGSFTATFTNPAALSSSVFKITMQSSAHASGALGVNWTSRTSAADNAWWGITYGNGLFVAVGFSGSGNRVMTSPDGITWTARNSQSDINWSSVIYGNGTYVAVANTGGTSRVITSTDGLTWTLRNIQSANVSLATAQNAWYSVTYGNGLFVAVSNSGTTDRVITSPDGINWTTRTTPNNNFYSVTYGNGTFVAVAQTGTGNRVMTSPDGITWTSQSSAADSDWNSVAYGDGLFVAVATSGTGSRVMTSPDGITWSARTAATANSWMAVAYGNSTCVAVAQTGTGNRVMTSTP